MKKIFSVPDMSCKHCVGRIEKALEKASVSSYEILLENKEVCVDEAEADKLVAALSSAGYPPVAK